MMMIQHSVAALGAEGLLEAKTTPGSEDFFYYPVKRPNVKAGFWGLGTNLVLGLHHPDMHFDLNALAYAVRRTVGSANNFPCPSSPPRAKYCILCRLNEDKVTGIAANVERASATAF